VRGRGVESAEGTYLENDGIFIDIPIEENIIVV